MAGLVVYVGILGAFTGVSLALYYGFRAIKLI